MYYIIKLQKNKQKYGAYIKINAILYLTKGKNMFSKLKYILAGVIFSLMLVFGYVFMVSSDNTWGKNINKEFKPYKPNTEIYFDKDGNTKQYIETKNGWGGQEPKWRCTVGKESVIKLYIKDGMDTPLILNVSGFGVYDHKNDKYQKITLFANDKEITQWNISGDKKYVANIPASIMKDNYLTLRFVIDKPYVSDVDTRALGMAVKQINLRKDIGNKTKKKIGKWLKDKLNNI